MDDVRTVTQGGFDQCRTKPPDGTGDSGLHDGAIFNGLNDDNLQAMDVDTRRNNIVLTSGCAPFTLSPPPPCTDSNNDGILNTESSAAADVPPAAPDVVQPVSRPKKMPIILVRLKTQLDLRPNFFFNMKQSCIEPPHFSIDTFI
jgi:hypothetical protein